MAKKNIKKNKNEDRFVKLLKIAKDDIFKILDIGIELVEKSDFNTMPENDKKLTDFGMFFLDAYFKYFTEIKKIRPPYAKTDDFFLLVAMYIQQEFIPKFFSVKFVDNFIYENNVGKWNTLNYLFIILKAGVAHLFNNK